MGGESREQGYIQYLSQTSRHAVSESDRYTCSTCLREEYMEPVVSKEKTISTGPLGGGGPAAFGFLATDCSAPSKGKGNKSIFGIVCVFIVFCMGRSKAKSVLYFSYSTVKV